MLQPTLCAEKIVNFFNFVIDRVSNTSLNNIESEVSIEDASELALIIYIILSHGLKQKASLSKIIRKVSFVERYRKKNVSIKNKCLEWIVSFICDHIVSSIIGNIIADHNLLKENYETKSILRDEIITNNIITNLEEKFENHDFTLPIDFVIVDETGKKLAHFNHDLEYLEKLMQLRTSIFGQTNSDFAEDLGTISTHNPFIFNSTMLNDQVVDDFKDDDYILPTESLLFNNTNCVAMESSPPPALGEKKHVSHETSSDGGFSGFIGTKNCIVPLSHSNSILLSFEQTSNRNDYRSVKVDNQFSSIRSGLPNQGLHDIFSSLPNTGLNIDNAINAEDGPINDNLYAKLGLTKDLIQYDPQECSQMQFSYEEYLINSINSFKMKINSDICPQREKEKLTEMVVEFRWKLFLKKDFEQSLVRGPEFLDHNFVSQSKKRTMPHFFLKEICEICHSKIHHVF